ncbi:MAG: DUF599 domain-containing protein [Paracoccus sp. (in: a-proteobacteria)]|uniref:DUF599 domain-containing protein n=1 Tax=Paracoccus sp. TaxID=267 RepID=UPI0026DF5FF6|nr:DUF599 domain-containing protein [Paracoccus sp. (in: a-proteobacteria)]MDO5612090.1 DUF599 domain-containing protein [Paracoccus sp. (in: a-proteobacteria)]
MILPELTLAGVTPVDLLGLLLLVPGWLILGWLIEHPPQGKPSVSVLMQRYRREWMRHFVNRAPRIFDGNVLSSLREGTAFFASACMIALGGGLALVGNVERLRGLAAELDLAPMAGVDPAVKLLLTLIFVANAFLKFVWAHRLFGYCAILMAAVPDHGGDPQALPRADQAADVNIQAAKNFNAGLRSVYFALGSLAWLGGGWTLCLGAGLVLWVTWRREFASSSRQVILRALPPARLPDAAAQTAATDQKSPPPQP